MRIPNRFIEHPWEAVIAGLLLLALLFISADPPVSVQTAPADRIADSQKM
jgi:hypothetical protein